MRVLCPWLMAAQPSACALVGASNVASNQARTAGPNGARGSSSRAPTGPEYRPHTSFRTSVRLCGEGARARTSTRSEEGLDRPRIVAPEAGGHGARDEPGARQQPCCEVDPQRHVERLHDV